MIYNMIICRAGRTLQWVCRRRQTAEPSRILRTLQGFKCGIVCCKYFGKHNHNFFVEWKDRRPTLLVCKRNWAAMSLRTIILTTMSKLYSGLTDKSQMQQCYGIDWFCCGSCSVIFRAFDADQDGQLTFKEWRLGYKIKLNHQLFW